MTDVLLLNASYQVLARIDWQRAIVLVTSGEAETIESDADRWVRSPNLALPWPTIVRLHQYRHVTHHAGRPRTPSFAQIKLRDGRRCAYCGRHGDTVDHVIPRSRGGSGEWDNLVCACRTCNNRKADRTPVEAGMKLLWAPRPIVPDVADQERVWALLVETG